MTNIKSSYEFRFTPVQWKLGLNWNEFLWYKDFLMLLIWRNISVRYRQTIIGISWVVVQPTINLIVFTLVFNRMAGIQSSYNLPYPIFLMIGLLFWQYFSTTLTFASNVLIDNVEIINKVYVPRYMLPLSTVISIGIDFLITAGLLLLVLLCYGMPVPILFFLLLPLMFLCTALLTLGLGFILSSINAQFRDVRFVVPFFLQVMFYLTPVFYPIEILANHPLLKKFLIVFNPLTGIITFGRMVMAGTDIDISLIGISFASSLIIFLVGWAFFRSRENILADII